MDSVIKHSHSHGHTEQHDHDGMGQHDHLFDHEHEHSHNADAKTHEHDGHPHLDLDGPVFDHCGQHTELTEVETDTSSDEAEELPQASRSIWYGDERQ